MAKREFKDFYDLAGGSVENIVCQFIQFLNKSESGLQVLYKPNESFGNCLLYTSPSPRDCS